MKGWEKKHLACLKKKKSLKHTPTNSTDPLGLQYLSRNPSSLGSSPKLSLQKYILIIPIQGE